jgi:Type ISP C-terminal specificity domain
LCRLLRDEVAEALAEESDALTTLAADWRDLLFPQATDKQFADGYAQAVTFGLLTARARGIPIASGMHVVSQELNKTSSLIGTACAYRSFDRQWIIPDSRLINQPNPKLWDLRSQRQLYMTAFSEESPSKASSQTRLWGRSERKRKAARPASLTPDPRSRQFDGF